MRLTKLGLVMLLAVAVLATSPLMAQRIHLDLEGDNDFINSLKDPNGPFGVPPNCSTWHELAPDFCKIHHQKNYFDTDNNGCLTPCDGIQLDDQWYHIVWVGWTIFCEDGSWILEPADIDPIDPTITSWFEVAPNYGQIHKMSDWNRADGTKVNVPIAEKADGHRDFPEPLNGDLLTFEDSPSCEIVRRSVDIVVEPRDSFGDVDADNDSAEKPF